MLIKILMIKSVQIEINLNDEVLVCICLENKIKMFEYTTFLTIPDFDEIQ